jgi:hypothetical protein
MHTDYQTECDEYQDTTISVGNYRETGDAVYALLEELYNSRNDINKNRITEAMAYLCVRNGIDPAILAHEDSLCVVHWRKKRKE